MFGKRKPENSSFGELTAKLHAWSIPPEALDRVHDGAKASLAEVKALTEYEDGKASRLLTIIAFLSALVGAVFTRFATDYPWPGFGPFNEDQLSYLTIAAYLGFFAYVILVTASVLIFLSAVKPRFNIPESWKGSNVNRPASTLFYEGILKVTAPAWGQTFIDIGSKNEGKDLKALYAKCYIAESHLVADKVAVKLRLLKPAVGMLQAAMWVLLAFFFLAGANVMLVKSANSGAASKMSPPAANPPAPGTPPGKKGG
ncbi:hypothetical protein [Bradyrhizobium brasilense]|uniref:hypothetical protein n=1 Tax=Bradyrhizobium brasilense TaxID=1419277 RepID=UPI001E33898B|nr:hypothetical protein [Bradyrhizobium brasilense]MCC8968911.1 hypothetical protein [Bradyrhizobium brasilense]